MGHWLIFGFILSGILHAWIPSKFINKQISGSKIINIFKATLFGIPLPLCSCGVIPTGISLYKNGASKSSTNAFFISTPQTGVDSIMVTYSFMGLGFALTKPISALLSGLLGGFITREILQEKKYSSSKKFTNNSESNKSFNSKLVLAFRYGFIEMIQDLYKSLVLGLLLAALVSALVPENFFNSFMGGYTGKLLSILALSVPLYVCATGSIPIALSFIMKGLSPGLALLFLMAGPATNMATLSVLYKSMGWKSTFAYLLSIILGAIISALVIDFLLPVHWFTLPGSKINLHAHGEIPIWKSLSAIFLILITLYAIFEKRFLTKKKINTTANDLELKVTGMSCNHCKASVENGLIEIEGIKSVIADPETDTVIIEGMADEEKIKSVILGLGFEIPSDH